MENDEIWADIPGFPGYSISSLGRIANLKWQMLMQTSQTIEGHVKISLQGEDGRHTLSVKKLVARAFVYQPSPMFNAVINLDGDITNVEASNLQWRPRWFAWRYHRQYQDKGNPVYFRNIPIYNQGTGYEYPSIEIASKTDGVLMEDVLISIRTGALVFPDQGPYVAR